MQHGTRVVEADSGDIFQVVRIYYTSQKSSWEWSEC